MPSRDQRPGLFAQFREVLSNEALPTSVRVLFGVAFSFGLVWSLSIAVSNLLAP